MEQSSNQTMPLDSIFKKQGPKGLSAPRPAKGLVIPVIVIVVIVAVIWFLSLRYNLSRINRTNQSKPNSAARDINDALENLTEEFDKLKKQKIFSQTQNSATNTTPEFETPTEIISNEPATKKGPLPGQHY